MVWQKTRPAGNVALRQSDNNLRENAEALEAALDLEHFFETGGQQDGRHRFAPEDDTARAVSISSPEEGNIHINDGTDHESGNPYLEVYTSSAWASLDVDISEVARTDVSKTWTEAQVATYEMLTPAAGSIAWDYTDASVFKVTLSAGTLTAYTLASPTTTVPANAGGVWLFEVTQGGSADHTLAFGADFVPEFGAQPVIQTGASAITYIWVYSGSDQKLIYSVRYR